MSRNNTPERSAASPGKQNKSNYDDEPEETLGERLMGLTEMFPEPVRNFTGKVVNLTWASAKNFYNFSRHTSWIFFTSTVILISPILLETERAQLTELQHSHQKQVLLGPGSLSKSGPTR